MEIPIRSREDEIRAYVPRAMEVGDDDTDAEVSGASAILGGAIGMCLGDSQLTPDVFLGVDEGEDDRSRLKKYQQFMMAPDMDLLKPKEMKDWEDYVKEAEGEAEKVHPYEPNLQISAIDALREEYVFNKKSEYVRKANGETSSNVRDSVESGYGRVLGTIGAVGSQIFKGAGSSEVPPEDMPFLPQIDRDAANANKTILYGRADKSMENARRRLDYLRSRKGLGKSATNAKETESILAEATPGWDGLSATERLQKEIDYASSVGSGARLTPDEMSELEWLESMLAGDGKAYQDAVEHFAERDMEIAKLKRRALEGKAIAEYQRKMDRDAIGKRMLAIRDGLMDKDSYDLMSDSLKTDGLTPDNYERFKALPSQDKMAIAPILADMRGEGRNAWLADAGIAFVGGAYDLARSAVEYPWNRVVQLVSSPGEYQTYMENKALLEQATTTRRKTRYGLSDWTIDAIATLPYMVATKVPYVGAYLTAAQFLNSSDKNVAAQGGDISSLDYVWSKYALAVAYVAVERMQADRLMPKSRPVQQWLSAISTRENIAKPVRMMASGGRLLVKMAENSAWESAEEGMQGAVEGALEAIGTDRSVSAAIAEHSINDFVESIGPMMVLSGASGGASSLMTPSAFSKENLINTGKYIKANIDEFKAMQNPYDVMKSGKLGEYELKLGEIARSYEESGGRAGEGLLFLQSIGLSAEDADAVSQTIDAVNGALRSREGVVSDKDYAKLPEAQREGVVSESMRSEMSKHAMGGHAMRSRLDIVMDMVAPKGSNVQRSSVHEEENGDITYEGVIKGRDGKEHRYRNTIHFTPDRKLTTDMLDPKSPDFDAGIAREFIDNENAKRIAEAERTGKEPELITLEMFNLIDISSREAMIAKTYVSGKFHMENGLNADGLGVMTGRIDVGENANLLTVLHEQFHAMVRAMRETGELTDEDIEHAVERFGKPRTSGELFNEEVGAEQYRAFMKHKVDLTEHSFSEKILRKADEIYRAAAAVLHLDRQEAQWRAEMQDGLFAAVSNGNFKGIPSAYPGKPKAKKVRAGKDKPDEQKAEPREEDSPGDEEKPTWEARSNDGAKSYKGSYVVMDADRLIVDPTEDMDGVSDVTDPNAVMDTGALDSGMPIVDGAGNVISGGRTAYGLKMAASNGTLGEVEERTRTQAKLLGIEIGDDIKHPVLLRARDPKMTDEEVQELWTTSHAPHAETEEVEDKAQAAAQVINASPDKKALVKTIETDDQLRDGMTAVFQDSPHIQEVTDGLVTSADRIKTRKISEGVKSALPDIMDAKEKNGSSGIDVEIPWALSQVTDFMGTEEGKRGNVADFVRFQRRTGATENAPEDVNRLAREIYKRRKSKIEVGKFLKGYAAGLREGLDTHDAIELEMLNNGPDRYSLSNTAPMTSAGLQYQAVHDKYFGTDKWMKAPNGEPTKLTERQWIQVRTPNFKAWFGDWENDPENASKVIDENGEPLVVYHGTPFGGWTVWDKGMRGKVSGVSRNGISATSNKEVAMSYTKAISSGEASVSSMVSSFNRAIKPVEEKVQDIIDENGINASTYIDSDAFYDYASEYMNMVDEYDFDSKEEYEKAQKAEEVRGYEKALLSVIEDIESGTSDELVLEALRKARENISPREYMPEVKELFVSGDVQKEYWMNDEGNNEKYLDIMSRANKDIDNGADVVIIHLAGEGTRILAGDGNNIKSATDNAGDFSKDNDDIRYSLSNGRGVLGGDNLFTAFLVGEILNKRYDKRDPADYEIIRRVFGARISVDEAYEAAQKLLAADRENRAQALFKKLTPAKAMTELGEELERKQIGKIMAELGRGESRGALYGSKASNAIAKEQKRAVMTAKGAHLADLESHYGLDVEDLLMRGAEKVIEEEARKRAEKKAKRAAKKPPETDVSEEEMLDEDGVVIETDEDVDSDASVQRQADQKSVLEELMAELDKIKDPSQRKALLEKYGVVSEGEDMESYQIRDAILQRFGSDILRNGGMMDLISTIVRKYVEEKTGKTGDSMWLDAGAVQTYKLTMADILEHLMRDLVPAKKGSDRVNITKTIEQMKSVRPSTIRTVKDGLRAKATIDRFAKKALVQIQKASVKSKKKELIDNLDKACKKLVKSNDKDALAEFTKKTIEGQVGVIAKMVRRAIRMNSNEVGEKIEKLNKELNEIQARYDEEGAEALDGSQDRNVVLKQMELRVLDIFGALNERSIADIQNVSDFAKEYFEVNLQRFLRRQDEIRRRIDEAKAILVSTLPKDVPASGKDSWATRFGNWNAATLRSRLTLAVAGVKDEKERERALRLVDDIMFLVSESSQKRIVLNNKYAKMMAEAVRRSIDGTGHSPRWFMDKMTEKIPDELSRQITRQDHYKGGGKDSRMTWDQLMHVYGFLCQPTSYLNNIEKHNRQGQKEIIEANTPPEILRFVKNLREVYEERRAELSQAMMDVTGFPVFRADPMFLPVRMFIGNKSGLSTQMLSVNNAIAPSLAPRVKNDRDVDESVGLMSLYHTSSKQVANAIAFGSSGIYLRDVLTDGEFLGGIKRAYGEGEAEGLRNQVTDLVTDGYRLPQGKDIEGSIAFMNTVVTYASLSGNLASAGKQLGGIPSWVAVMRSGKYREVWKYILQFDRDAMRELVESDGFYARYGENGASLTSIWKILKDPNERILMRPLKAGMVPLQMADKWASIIVGAGLYKANVERLSRMGLGDAEAKHRAMIETWAAVEEAQQSDRIENTNEFMRRRGILAKSMMKFASSPMLQASNESQAFRVAYRSGRSEDWRKAGNIFFANHVFIPLLMQLADFVVDLVMHEEPEDDEWKTRFLEALVASIIGQYGRILFVGSLSETFMREAVGLKTWHTSGIASYDYAYKMTRFAASSIHDLFGGDFDGAWDNFWKSILSSTAAIRYSSRFAENWELFGLDKED